ncbi:hypothetical protein R3Q06_32075 [Rhodococcus erythropolis]|uniref:three-helix bundle dimerization domain-containing protein n=1 Tax=Rhodococcus erythropolis TaxID=1833 RepID=UPI00294A8537|nr:hypothetical protein [Rhodococcus erythropolis]MDV6278113.1 hypothetical protein [Rhodococcus erythropolis]
MVESEEHDIDAVRTRLIERYRDLDPEVITDVVVATLGRFDGCRIRDFVSLLVERAAVHTLDAEYCSRADPESMHAPELPAAAHTAPAVRAANSFPRLRRVFARRSPRLS